MRNSIILQDFFKREQSQVINDLVNNMYYKSLNKEIGEGCAKFQDNILKACVELTDNAEANKIKELNLMEQKEADLDLKRASRWREIDSFPRHHDKILTSCYMHDKNFLDKNECPPEDQDKCKKLFDSYFTKDVSREKASFYGDPNECNTDKPWEVAKQDIISL